MTIWEPISIRQIMVLIRKLKFEQQGPHWNWSWTQKLKMVYMVLFHKWHSSCCWRQQPVICHTWWPFMSKDKWSDLQSAQTKHISVHSWHGLKQDYKIHDDDPYEAEHRFNWETYTPSAGVAGILRHINGKFTRWTFKLPLIKKVLFKLWSRSSCISGTC
jgi:hypothetical protein